MPMPKTRTTEPAAAVDTLPATYEAAVQELEQLVARLDAGQLPLDQVLSQYQRGATLLALCRERLQAVENQIKVLDAGELKPWTAD
jgi:exodeoxyribonuclease VII small subunit